MARKPTQFPEQGVQKSEFKWTKDMTQKDRGSCKTYIDGILSDVEKRDRAILDLGEQLTKMKLDVNRKLQDVRDRKDYEIGLLKRQLEEKSQLYCKAKSKNNTYLAWAIICLAVALIVAVLSFC